MRLITGKTLLITWIFILSTQASATENVEKWSATDYIIGPGDSLHISVWKNEELTKLLTVLPDGKVSFPLIGDVIAEGKTVAQLRKELEGRISRFVPAPVLSVLVQQVNSMLIYVVGKVNNPGRFVLNCNIKVLQGLALAGGLNPFAERNKIKIFREEGGDTRIFHFKYDSVSTGKNLEQNIRLNRGDVIVVP